MAISEDPDVPAATPELAEIRAVFELAPSPDSRCFYCGDAVRHPAIYWSGGSHIWLHADCALGLIGGLLQDVRRLGELERLRAGLRDRRGR